MTYADRPIKDVIPFRDTRPRRPQLLFFMHHMQTIVTISLAVIILLSALPYSTGAPITLLVGYCVYQYLFLRWWKNSPARERSNTVDLLVTVVPLFVGVTLFLAYMEWYTPYSSEILPDTLWLLYLPVLYIVCQKGHGWALIIGGAACSLAMLVIRLWTPDAMTTTQLLNSLRAWVIASLWLAVLSMTFMLVARYISEMLADFELIAAIQTELATRAPFRDEDSLLKQAVEQLRDNLSHDHFNIFSLESDGSLHCRASAASVPDETLDEGYTLPPGAGILGRVLRTGDVDGSNDVQNDPDYVREPVFAETRSEFGAPIYDVRAAENPEERAQGRRTMGVLDFQANRRDMFLESDEHLIRIAANLLGDYWVNFQLQDRAATTERRFYNTLRSLMRTGEGSQQVAAEARDALNAAVIVLFERDAGTGLFEVTAHDGQLNQPTRFQSSSMHGRNLVDRIAEATVDAWFQPDIGAVSDDPVWNREQSDPVETFAQREEIVSRSVFRLRAGNETIGVLFANYREHKNFTLEEQERQRRFIEFASLILHSRQQQRQRLAKERTALSALLHDGPLNRASITSELIGTVLDEGSIDAVSRKRLIIAHSATRHIAQDIRFLERTWGENPTGDLCLMLSRMAREAEQVYRFAVVVRMEVEQLFVPAQVVSELGLIVAESLRNAHEHGNADRVEVTVSVAEQDLSLAVIDNGEGFDPELTQGHGITNMKYRAECCRGVCDVFSTPNQGTRVQVHVPLAVE